MTTQARRTRGMPRRSAARAADDHRRRLSPAAIGLGILAVFAVAAAVAVAISAPASGAASEPAREATRVSGQALPELTDPAADAAVGMTVPELIGTDLSGAPISIGPSDGPMAVVLLAHWCPHCQAEVPVLVDYLATTGMPDGVTLVAISTSIDPARPNFPPSAWLERESWDVPTLVDDASSSALDALGMASFPGFVFVDADGHVALRHTGEMTAEQFDEAVNHLAP